MGKKFEYDTILIKGSQNLIYAEFPFDGVKEFGTRKTIRVKVSFDGRNYEMSLLPRGNGKHWLHVRKEIRMAIGKEEGDSVVIVLEKDNSVKAVDVPEYLQWLLEDDLQMMKSYNKMPYSAKSFWINHIEETKNKDTRVERINRFFDYINKNFSG